MNLAPTLVERLARARSDLRMGLPIAMIGEASGLVFSAETLQAERLSEVLAMDATPVLAITDWRAQTLKVRAYDGDLARIALPRGATVDWIKSIANPADDLNAPMKGPLASLREGRSDLHRAAIALAKSARLLPALLIVLLEDAEAFAAKHSLTAVPLKADLEPKTEVSPLVSARLPLEVSEQGRLHVFRPSDRDEEHYAVEIGKPDRETSVLCRLHSACFTGDLLGSLKCDCGPQLRGAMAHMGTEGSGILLYLNQEGRGIGLANKMRAYSLQDQGFDTVEANHRLGFEDDERDFQIGSDILKSLGFRQIRLMTNNPAKVGRMEDTGIKVTERVPLIAGHTAHNQDYLATKAKKSGHLL